MKKIVVVFLLCAPILCLSQKPVIEIMPNGLSVDTAYFFVGDKMINDNTFTSGTKLFLKLTGIHGFSIKDGKSFPGCSMKIIDNGKAILDYQDLFSDQPEGVDSKDARYINLTLTVGSPMMENKSYRWEARVWDKSTKAEVSISTTIKVSQAIDMVGIQKTTKGLTADNIFLLSDEPLKTNQVKEGNKVTIIFSGLRGFTLNQEKLVNLGASMIVKDKNNVTMLEETDLFKEGKSYDPLDAESLRMYLTLGDPLLAGGTYTWISRIWDKNSQKSIEAAVKLEVIK